jgi:hypothetical protein
MDKAACSKFLANRRLSLYILFVDIIVLTSPFFAGVFIFLE